jgi:palmitoyltransferase ZDHHC9/14/18
MVAGKPATTASWRTSATVPTVDQCGNRPFAELKRRAKGNRYEYGVEVLDTADRGYGVRAMRCFDPFQIIVEYAGEIITQAECERRMKQIYKKDKVRI